MQDVPMATPEVAAGIYGMTQRMIYRRVEAGDAHFVESPNGFLLICLASLHFRPVTSEIRIHL